MLRNYQNDAVVKIKEVFTRGHKKVLLVMPTGAGKTVVFCHIVKEAISRARHALIVVRGRKLVNQASQRLFREAVPHGVLMAGHWNKRPHERVQVASIDTLLSRGLRPKADLIIVDEAHLACTGGYKEFLSQYDERDTYIVAVTATPYTDEGFTHLADDIVRPIPMQSLIDQGYLVPFRYYAPSTPDLSQVKTDYKTGDYKNDELGVAMSGTKLTGDILHHWNLIAQGRPTLCFAVNIKHSKMLCDMFKEAGVIAEHCDADTKEPEREAIIKRLEKGETQIICNVGIFCTGVDIPCLGAIIMARPTKSLNLFIQQAGRGTRTHQDKSNCILLDHAGNIERHGFPTFEPEVNLDGKIISERSELLTKICKNCFAAFRGKECPECGITPPTVERTIEVEEGQLSEIIITSQNPIEQYIELLEFQRKRGNRKKSWTYYKLIEKFDLAECTPYLPQWFIEQQSKGAFGHSYFQPFTGGG